MPNALLQYLTEHRREMIADITAFVEQETFSTDKPRLDAFAAFLQEFARARAGGSVTIVPEETAGDHVLVRWEGVRNDAPVMLIGHYDTVWPAGTLASTLPLKTEGDIMRGPGIFDMKTGLVQGFWALRALREASLLSRPVLFVCNSDEELGSHTSRALIEREARSAHRVLVLEPSVEGATPTSRKGVGMFEISIEGRAAHAGRDPFKGVSAIDELARLIVAIHAMTDKEAGSTLNVGVIAGGSARNVVAAQAHALIDLRVTSEERGQLISAALQALQPHHPEAKVRVSGGMNRPPMARSAEIAALYEEARAHAADIGFELREAASGGGSDANFCAALGKPVLDGLGAVGQGAHAPSEQIDTRFLAERTALIAALVAA